ncbi:TrkH family potassium uptake protein [Kordiimonas marina]|uniref:TrkH family potassium uptake protein n=1 Tax=Kordiimonas marina TaxID=2872312 RepID=UPI001FF2D81B|nr:TrkH family potassium uptake protein [Kordiimonas marina]
MNSQINLRPVIHIIGILLVALALVMAIPAVVEAMMNGSAPLEFLYSAIFTGFLGLMAAISTRDQTNEERLNVKTAFLLTSLSWIIVPAFAALPLLGLGLDESTGISYTDAVFETVSGMTTTGSTVLTGLDHMLPGLLLWRSLVNWIGGAGIIMMAIIMLPFLRIGGMQLFRTESSDQSEKIVPKSGEIVKKIAVVFVGLTVICAFCYWLAGMSSFDAINHALATIATGGFSTHDASFGYYGPAAQWVGIIFMIVGASPFIAFVKFADGDFKAIFTDPQIRVFLRFLTIVILVAAVMLMFDQHLGFFDALTKVAFNIVSIVSTTGFASADYTTWGTAAVMGFFLLMFVGGCAGSTSGAIKIYRFQVLWITLREQIMKLASPNRVVVLRYQGRRMPEDLPMSVTAFTAAFFASIVVVAILLSLMNLDVVTALSAAVSAVANIGPGIGHIIGPAGNFSSLPDPAKWLLSFAMILGRLEIFTLIMLFDPHFWRS